MEFAVGAILEGKVTGITKFGAFVALPGNKTGMVHISEIAHAYVSDISEYLTVGQEVKVKVIALDPAGKINLSIKKTVEPPPRQGRSDRPQRSGDRGEREGRGDRPQRSGNRGSYEQRQRPAARTSAPRSRSPLTICSSSLWRILIVRSPPSSSTPTTAPSVAAVSK
jgi:S1 RNA binding domain protein